MAANLCFHPLYLTQQAHLQQPWPLMPAMVLILSMVTAIGLAAWADIEVVTTAQGRIIPTGKVKTLRAALSGTVAELRVREGSVVKQGDLLLKIDDTALRAELRRVQQEWQASYSQQAALRQLDQWLTQGDLTAFRLQPSPALLARDARWAKQQALSFQDRLAALRREQSVLQAEKAIEQQALARAESLRRLYTQRHDIQQSAAKKNVVSRLSATESKIAWTDVSFNVQQVQATIALLNQQIESKTAELHERLRAFQLQLLEQLQNTALAVETLDAQRDRLQSQLANASLKAPRDGVVENLTVNSSDVFVAEGDALLSLVPVDAPLVAEVLIPSREAGFVRQGQQARIKVDAFPYTRYGSLSAELQRISADASTLDGQEGLFYSAQLRPEQLHFAIRGKQEPVSVGMSVTAEIITDQRRLLDFFVAPIKEVLFEALKER